MGRLKKSMVSYDKFCLMLDELIFRYDKMGEVEKLSVYDALLDSAEETEIEVSNMFENIVSIDEELNKDRELSDRENQIIMLGTKMLINQLFAEKTIKDGFCLKVRVKGHAVQMRNNEDMLGYISELIPNDSRFVMVDFGDEEVVKIDLEELNT